MSTTEETEIVWFIDEGEYPSLYGLDTLQEFYNNFNLTISHKFKVNAPTNDGYPYLFKIENGWQYKVPFLRDGVWKNDRVYYKKSGIWRESRVLKFENSNILYKYPDIVTAWRIESGKNNGYPFVIYSEIPFYESEEI